MKKWVKMFDDNSTTVLTDMKGLTFLDAREDGVEIRVNSIESQGTDGVMLGPASFGPFPLVLRFFYKGVDTQDYKLMKQKLRGMLFRRTPFYIVHSDIPAKKYAVYCEDNAITDVGHQNGEFEITFTVYKGYSESLYDTDQFSLMSDNWQFESGLLPDNEITYTHKRSNFEIFNGSSDTINPRMRHKLKIYMQLTANNGFRLVNKTTGDIFQYKQAIDINTPLVLEGGYPYLIVNDKYSRCGRSTNHGIITLAPGYNKFEIWGNAADVNIKFIFPFIYR
ncbi:phage tail family protein [Mammaliicoccus sciuri]|uniref:phage tail family protein n=1 Tax=Mammaliicoccus sciuri TaxID=1296 RepID=UPI002887C133|nr:phage tail family protein [Mammaliicoccus sciuri]MDT0754024.1 phage tail family protein [Mammaliicoccus sciuri]